MKVGSRGMSLVQVMVAMALLGVVAMFMMNLMKQGTQTQKTIDKNADMLTEVSRAQTILKDNETCNANFQGQTYAANTALTTGLKLSATGTNTFLVTGTKGISGLKIKEVMLEKPTEITPKGLGEFSLSVTFERDAAGAERTTLSSAELTKKITFFAVQCISKSLYATSDPSAPYEEKRMIAREQMEESCGGGYIDEESFAEAGSNFWVANCFYSCADGSPIAKCSN